MNNQFAKLQKNIEKEADKREERCVPIAHFILEEFVNSKVSLKVSDFQEVMKAYEPIYQAVIKEGFKQEWMLNDILFSIKLFIRLTENLKNVLELSLIEHQENAIKKVLGGRDAKKLTIKEIDEILKK